MTTASTIEDRKAQPVVSQPRRIQLSRKKGWRLPPNTLNVARPSRYGNPHRIGFCPVCGVTHTRDEAVAEFEAELSQLSANHFEVMRGKNLACWCKIIDEDGHYVPCHADLLLALANGMSHDEVRNENLKTHKGRAK